MSGTGIIIASALPMAVLCTSTPEPGQDPDYAVTLVGERDPNAVHGVGITYGVDGAAFGEWIARNADIATLVRETDQGEIDAWSDEMSQYGFEAGLDAAETPTPGGLGALVAARAAVDLHAMLALAGEQRRAAETQLRQAEAAKRDADAAAEAATQARDEAEAAQKAAMAAIEAQAAPAPAAAAATNTSTKSPTPTPTPAPSTTVS